MSNKEILMRNILCLLAVMLFSVGCAKQDDVEMTEPVAADSSAEETAAGNGPDAYYEYLWCNAGEDFSEEKFAELTTNWNSVIDEMQSPALAAFAYVPRDVEVDEFDGLWVLRWESKSDSLEGWDAYANSEAAQAHEALYATVLSCGDEVGVNRFGFNSYIPQPMPATFTGEPGPYFLTNTFCSFNEGKGPDDLRSTVMNKYLPMLSAGAEVNPQSSYWFMVGVPDFEERPAGPYDFNWINYWQTLQEGEASSTAFANSEEGQAMMTSFNEVASCQPAQSWDGYLIRSNLDA